MKARSVSKFEVGANVVAAVAAPDVATAFGFAIKPVGNGRSAALLTATARENGARTSTLKKLRATI